MKEKKQKKKDEKTSNEAEVEKSLEAKSNLENKMPLGMQIVIGLLVVVILGLLGYIMYQVGKGGASNKNNESVVTDKIGDNKNELVSSEQNNQGDSVLENNNKTEVSDVVSKKSISTEDLNKLDDELDGISTNYDDLEDVGTDLQKWTN